MMDDPAKQQVEMMTVRKKTEAGAQGGRGRNVSPFSFDFPFRFVFFKSEPIDSPQRKSLRRT